MLKSQVIRPQLYSASPPRIRLFPNEEEALKFLGPLSDDYPGIDEWFYSKVVPGLRVGTRKLVTYDRGGEIAALGIAKRESGESKICTVRVSQSFVGKGMGLRIFDDLLRWLDIDHPHLTVSATKLPAFQRVFDYYGFRMTSVQHGRYLPGCPEYSYNERGSDAVN